MTDLEHTKRILNDLISFPTISSDSNLAMIDYLSARLTEAGARVEVFGDPSGTKANLFATIGPDVDGGIVLSGHTDVVPVADQDWTSDPFEMVERDQLLFGRGTCDMKGFIAAAVAMAPTFAEAAGSRPIHFAFTHDEEVGCIGAQALVEELRKRDIRPGVTIIGEPTSMRIIEGHKGCCEYTTHFTGLEGHGANPDLGVNAVEYATRYVSRLLELREALKARTPPGSRFVPPWTSINVGSVIGGVAHNVIAGKAEVEWDMRPVQKSDAAFVHDDLNAYCNDVLLPAMRAVHPGSSITTEALGDVAGLEPVDDNEAFEIVSALTGSNQADVVPFGTEAGIFQAMGMSVVVCGPGSIEQAHKPDEFIALDQLEQCLEMLRRLAHRLD
ncbi:acetylornithine deacetylase [Aliiroseovarius sp. YM-037]|uniref:acetylornithine deacetylase n=1 Tax=Aliiroseovarius sp. YM-037 TaxID=3341728 RepID=UPI003A802AFA